MLRAIRSMLSVASALALAGAVGCSGDASPDPLTGNGDAPLTGDDGQPLPEGEVSCAEDARIDTYTDNMDKPGELGVLSFRFSDVEPAPPAKGSNTFHVRVTGANGAPVTGALHVALTMPDHGHGTPVTPVVSFDAATDEYTVTPLYLFMAGVWRIQFEAYAGTDQGALPLDRTRLFFCIQG
jgi:hypothetical protein